MAGHRGGGEGDDLDGDGGARAQAVDELLGRDEHDEALGACPTNHITVIEQFLAAGCPDDGWTPYKVDSGPTVEPGQCCYVVELYLCPGSGRPFLVDGRRSSRRPRCARPGAGGVTRTSSGRDRPSRARGARRARGRAWTADALLEHASVASFSRLSLALLAVGAPADLVALAHRAALDEIRHARLCFALA